MLDDIKKTLWAAADKLRANMDAAEYKRQECNPTTWRLASGQIRLPEAMSMVEEGAV